MREPLALAWETPRAWAAAALEHPLLLLSDHAHCELGAAAASQALLARHPGKRRLVQRLSACAIEELRHFRAVHALLLDLGGELGPARRNPYAEGLLALAGRGPDALLDRLLVSALIERRSRERFECLERAARARAPRLAHLWSELAPSEAGHAALFVELAGALFPADEVEPRLERWIQREGQLLSSLPFAPRIHSGPPALESGSRSADGVAS